MLKEVLEVKHNATIVEKHTNYLMNVSNQLQDMSDLQSGSFKVKFLHFNVDKVVSSCIAFITSFRKDVVIKKNIGLEVPGKVFGDSERISLILQ